LAVNAVPVIVPLTVATWPFALAKNWSAPLVASTQLEDKSSAQIRPFKLSDLHVGDFAQGRGVEQTAGATITVDSSIQLNGSGGSSGPGGGGLTQSQLFMTLSTGIHAVRIRRSQANGVAKVDRIDITS
jgi:hypothetical protein